MSVRELKNSPSQALRDAREGPVLVLNHGQPEALLVSVGEGAPADLPEWVGEAIETVRGLAERKGARAVRAVDVASRAAVRQRRVGEAAAPYGSGAAAAAIEIGASATPSAAALAALVGGICTLANPRRIALAPEPSGAAGPATVVVDMEQPPAVSVAGRVSALAARVGLRALVRAGGECPPQAPAREEVLFDRADVPLSVLDRLVAEGRAIPPSRRGPIPVPTLKLPDGVSLSDILEEMREDRL